MNREQELLKAITTAVCLGCDPKEAIITFEHQNNIRIPQETQSRLIAKVNSLYETQRREFIIGSKFFLSIETYMAISCMAIFTALAVI